MFSRTESVRTHRSVSPLVSVRCLSELICSTQVGREPAGRGSKHTTVSKVQDLPVAEQQGQSTESDRRMQRLNPRETPESSAPLRPAVAAEPDERPDRWLPKNPAPTEENRVSRPVWKSFS